MHQGCARYERGDEHWFGSFFLDLALLLPLLFILQLTLTSHSSLYSLPRLVIDFPTRPIYSEIY